MGETLKRIIKDPERKSFLRMGMDLSRLLIKYKKVGRLQFYGTQLMYKKDAGKLNDYLPPQIYRKFKRQNSNKWRDSGLNDKLIFHDLMKKNNLPVPKYIGKIQNGCFYDENNKKIPIENHDQLKTLIGNQLKTVPDLFVKPSKSSQGKGIQRIKKDTLNKVSEIDFSKDYIIQETLRQHKSISKISPNCVNSLRVITYRKGNKTLIPSCHFVMGVGNDFLANGNFGSIRIAYNIDTNTLSKVGYKGFKFGGTSYSAHPDTHFKFEGKGLIFPKEVKEIVTKAASLVFEDELIGWDIAFSNKGPCILEGNHSPGMTFPQIYSKGLLKNTSYLEIFNEFLKSK